MISVTAGEMRRIEETAFGRGVDPGELMDLAGAGIARRLLDHFPTPGRAIGYVGKGNNGGDSYLGFDLVAAVIALQLLACEDAPLAIHRGPASDAR